MTDDLIAFLRARLDEDEQVAQAATNHTGRWSWQHDHGRMCDDPTCPMGELLDEANTSEGVAGTVLMEVHGYDIKEPGEGATHIARHDPARVLREVAAKRQQITHYERVAARSAQHHDYELAAGACAVSLRCVAFTYADHPEYRQEWAP